MSSNQELSGTEETNNDIGETTSNQSDGDHEVDDWSEKQIGFLAARILSDVKARKETEGANYMAPSVSIAQASLGGREDAASNLIGMGGAEKVLPARFLPIATRQQPPDTQTKREALKDRAVTRSGDW